MEEETEENKEDEGISKKLDKLLDNFESNQKKEKEKKFKLPLGIRFSGRKTRKRNYVIVMLINTNGSVVFKMMKIDDETITLSKKDGSTIHGASADYILRYKKYPLIIIPRWNMQPFKPSENMSEAEKNGTLSELQKIILLKMKLEAVKSKMNINIGMVLLIIGLLIGGYFLLTYLKIIPS